MGKRSKNLLVIYPYKFSDLVWDLLEIDQLKAHCIVDVLDISIFFNKRAHISSNAILGRNRITTDIDSFYKLSLYLFKYVLEKHGSNTVIINEVPRNSIIGECVNLLLFFINLKNKFKIVNYINGGVPFEASAFDNETLRQSKVKKLVKLNNITEAKQLFIVYLFALLNKIFPDSCTHKIVAGKKWEKLALRKHRDRQKLVFANSSDYSNFIRTKKETKNSKISEMFVMLDSPGPKFAGDTIFHKKKSQLTSEVWYPLLNGFFHHLVQAYGLTPLISVHYKSNIEELAPFYPGLMLQKGETVKYVAQSQFVVATTSTAISYAVVFKKPVILIYSDQSSKDLNLMAYMQMLSEELDSPLVNINDKNIELRLKVNLTKYTAYQQNYLTSLSYNLPNFEILLNEVF
jgi:hypothetical protein